MAKMEKAVSVFQVILAVLMVVCVSSCNESQNIDEGLFTTRSATDLNRPSARWECTRKECHPVDTGFWHINASDDYVSFKGNTEKYSASAKSVCAATLTPEIVDIVEDFEVKETSSSRVKAYVKGYENETLKFNFNDSREISFNWSAEHPEAVSYAWTDEFGEKHEEVYEHGFDTLVYAKFIKAYPTALTRGDVPDKYIKRVDLYVYEFEVVTAPVKGNGEVGELHTDIVRVKGLSRVWDTNGATATLKKKGSKPISDVEEVDSLEIILTWDDGHKEELFFKRSLSREIKALDRRKEIVSSLDNEGADVSFNTNSDTEQQVSKDENWTVYEKKGTFAKNCFVHGAVKEVSYMWKQQRAVFHFLNLEIPFDYNDWNFTNISDDFESVVSDMTGYDQEDYINRVSANYNGWKHNLSEVIAWYAKAKEIVEDSCVVVNKFVRTDDNYIHFGGNRVIYYSDGTTKDVGKINLDVLWKPLPETNWLIETDHLGTYVSNELSLNYVSTEGKTQGSFSYNQSNYRFKNFVSGKQNSGIVAIVKGCKYNDGKFACSFDDVELKVEKGSEATTKSGSEAGIDTYSYGCEAIVRYGDGVKRVTLPGTIKVDNRSHEHGRVEKVYFTTVRSESFVSYKSCAVILFTDGFRSIGLCENAENFFTFSMSSVKDGINSAVYADGHWMPATVVDDTDVMRWRDENGVKRDVVEYLSATADPWNNGHNTSVDVRREYRVSADGYSVTFYLNGQVGQTLNF